MYLTDPKLWFKIQDGVLDGEGVECTLKYLKDVSSLYKADIAYAGYDSETVVYEVYSYGKGDESLKGNLFWGLTAMCPVYIDGECNMTRGHYHEDRNYAEYYLGVSGEELLLLMNDSGDMWAEKVEPGSLHYVDGRYAHRLVNTGDTVFEVGACWLTSAGHDYASVERSEFPYRVYRIDGKIQFVKR